MTQTFYSHNNLWEFLDNEVRSGRYPALKLLYLIFLMILCFDVACGQQRVPECTTVVIPLLFRVSLPVFTHHSDSCSH